MESLKIALLRLLRRPGYLIALLLLPLLLFAGGRLLPQEGQETELLAGLSFEGKSETAEKLVALLTADTGPISFRLSDPETLREQVAAGRWECGYLFPADLEERIRRGEWDALVTLVTSEGAALEGPVTELISAALLEVSWGKIAEKELDRLGLEGETDLPLEEALPEENWVALQVLTLEGTGREETASAELDYGALLPGAAALWLFWAALLAGLELKRYLGTDYVRYAAPGTGLWPLLLPEWAVLTALSLASGLLSLVLAGAEEKAMGALLPYQGVLSLLMLVLALLPGTERWLPALLPVVPLLSVAASPLLVEVGDYLPALEPLGRLLPLTGYLCLLRAGDGGLLLAQGGVLALGALLCGAPGKRTKG